MMVKANGIWMNYEFSGRKWGEVIMLSHSLASSLAMWNPQMAALRAFYKVLRYDIRGHGQTEAPEGSYTLEQLGEDALALLDALKVDQVHWVGLSMGGMIGQILALNHADRLKSLALCDTTAVVPPEAHEIWEERIRTARQEGMQALVEETLSRWFTQAYLAQNPPEVEEIRRIFLATPVAGYVGCSQAIRQLNVLDRLPQIKRPTLIMVGREDAGTPVADAQAMHQAIAGSKLIILDSAAHLSNIQQARDFNRELLAFLDEWLFGLSQ